MAAPITVVGRTTIPLAAFVVAAACAFIPPQIECAPAIDRPTCDRIAAGILQRKRGEDPDRRIVSLRITDDRGSYELLWEDGMGEALIID